MAYDEDLANRIRELVLMEPGVAEKRMFGGLAFLIDGNMSVSVSGRCGRAADQARARAVGGARSRPRTIAAEQALTPPSPALPGGIVWIAWQPTK